jgi:hypothetical protein
MSTLDFRELHSELVREFYHYADKRGRDYLDSLMLMYWQARGPAFVGAAANYPGTKFLVTTDDASILSDAVPKALMLTDHVIIRHASLLPVSGVILGAIPVDFAGFGPIDWIEQHRDELPRTTGLPHHRSCPPPEQIEPFIDWLCTGGRQWFETGQVTYAPVIVSGDVESGLLTEGVNLNPFFRSARVVPQDDRLLNLAAVAALAELELPYLESVTPDLLLRLKEQEQDRIDAFRTHLLTLLNRPAHEIGSAEFSRELEQASREMRDETQQLQVAMRRYEQTASWRRLGVELLTLSASVFFYLGLTVPAVTGLTAAALDLVKTIKDDLKDKCDLKTNPLYFLARLGKVSRRRGARR